MDQYITNLEASCLELKEFRSAFVQATIDKMMKDIKALKAWRDYYHAWVEID